jgi:conjugative transfer signal peptidase TraF
MNHVNRRRVGAIAVGALGVILIAVASGYRVSPKIIYNPSSSAPRGWYVVKTPTELHRGDFALVMLPAPIARIAGERRYLPRTIPLLKQVGAVARDRVCERQGVVRVNDVVMARSLLRDGAGRPLSAWDECRLLRVHELFLIGLSNAASFDSRYYGPVSVESVIGVAIPLWTW